MIKEILSATETSKKEKVSSQKSISHLLGDNYLAHQVRTYIYYWNLLIRNPDFVRKSNYPFFSHALFYLRCPTLLYLALLYSTLPYSTLPYSTLLYLALLSPSYLASPFPPILLYTSLFC